MLGVLVFVHELGHYLAARWCGVHVEVFSIGFGPAIATWRDRVGTVWKLAWLPLGGYVKLHGQERPEVSPRNRASRAVAASCAGVARPQPRASRSRAGREASRWIPGRVFHEKPVGARALVVAAGPIANFLLAMVLFALLFATAGRPVILPVAGDVLADSAAARAGIQADDRIAVDRGHADRELRGHPAHHRRASGRDAAHHDPARPRDAWSCRCSPTRGSRAGARSACWASAAARSNISGSPCPRRWWAA